MGAPLSLDLRVRIIHAVEAGGATKQQIADRFDVCRATVYKLLDHYREHGTLENRLVGHVGRKPLFTPKLDLQLHALVDHNKNMTLERIRAELGLDCCLTTIWNRMIKLGLTHKKTAASRRTRPR